VTDDFNDSSADDLAELVAFSALYTEGEPAFEAITHLVRESLGTELAILSLKDEFHQWFKSSFGLSVRGVPYDVALSAYIPQLEEVVTIQDTAGDPLMGTNPIVTGAPFVRSYLGYPIFADDGQLVGTIAAAGTAVRGFTDGQSAALGHAATLVNELLNLRQSLERLDPTPVLVDRRRWDTMLQAELSAGGERPIVGLAEFDGYAAFADRHGSETTQAMMDWIMECATEMSPPDGRLSRLGEASFGFTLPDMSAAAARKLVQNLQDIVVDIVAEVTSDRTTPASITCVLSQPGENEPVNTCWDRMMLGLDQAKEAGAGAFIDLTLDNMAGGAQVSRTG